MRESSLRTRNYHQKTFGTTEPHCDVCAIGFEPNPHHGEHLDELEKRLRAAGVGVLIFRAAASDADGIVDFALGNRRNKDRWEDLGATASALWRGMAAAGNAKAVSVAVRSIDLARIIHAVHSHLQRNHRLSKSRIESPRKIAMKLDVEGNEFQILPHLIRTQSLCKLDSVRIEWHERYWSHKVATLAARAGRATGDMVSTEEIGALALENWTRTESANLRRMFRTFGASSRDCKVKVHYSDDESYIHDGKPWPNTTICARTNLSRLPAARLVAPI